MKNLLFLNLLVISLFLSSCFPPEEEETPEITPESTEPATDSIEVPAGSESTTETTSEPAGSAAPIEPAAESGSADAPVADVAPDEPAMIENPIVTISTSLGAIKLELFAKEAPLSVANFLTYAKEGYYKNTVVHRVIEGFMIQGGGFALEADGTIKQKDTKDPVQNEAKNGVKNARGTVAMARTSDPHSATSQFFINHADNANLDYPSFDGWGYAVFGKVIEGMDVIDKIAAVDTATISLVTKAGERPMENVPTSPIVIQSISISE